MSFLNKEEFELFKKYGGKYASDYPDAHAPLRNLYDKLGQICDKLEEEGFKCHIRRSPQNQGQKYETYHWAQLCPKYSLDSYQKIFFVIDFTQGGFGIHIDCNTRQGYYLKEKTEYLQSWFNISVDEVCSLSIDEIVSRTISYCRKHKLDFIKFGKEYGIKSCIKLLNMELYKKLLLNNKNLILTGAPGTGKTYLAKELASYLVLGKEYDINNPNEIARLNEQSDFVQFHPSYDYTDFVEGLRPIDDGNGNVLFRREDGVFMNFCRRALKAYQDSNDKLNAPKYVFIIDEINRGELSKIFGELFFCIDPSYRGVKGMVKTQYSNLWTNSYIPDQRKYGGYDKFFIPENVYIIGTLNDIDRSVENMDFAMRRRFAFKEILASERIDMIKENNILKDYFDDIHEHMTNLNNCITTIEGLNTAYQIGASYFLKLENYLDENKKITDESWENLWNIHICPLLTEYLRGMPDANENLQKLKEAYFS